MAIFHLTDVAILDDLSTIPRSLPLPQAPLLGLVPVLLVPALSLAFVGLVQGAAVSANFPNPDGSYPDASGDFVGQGVANVVSGVFQGMPVGGSMSASALNKVAGAKSRMALVISSAVMTVVILVFAGLVGHIAMPALAGLLIVIGCRTIKPGDLWSVWKTGLVQKVVVTTTFVLTMVIALQYAVLVGVGLSIILHVVRQSNEVTIRRWTFDGHGNTIEGDPPDQLPADESVVLQPYGSLFFAAAPVFESGLPEVTADSHNSCSDPASAGSHRSGYHLPGCAHSLCRVTSLRWTANSPSSRPATGFVSSSIWAALPRWWGRRTSISVTNGSVPR